jgi:hypothetical protein
VHGYDPVVSAYQDLASLLETQQHQEIHDESEDEKFCSASISTHQFGNVVFSDMKVKHVIPNVRS